MKIQNTKQNLKENLEAIVKTASTTATGIGLGVYGAIAASYGMYIAKNASNFGNAGGAYLGAADLIVLGTGLVAGGAIIAATNYSKYKENKKMENEK